ncbi:MAG: outer membrane protein assembly factor BamA [Treponema sp.]|nr:outer membrane protein assembly factor BamA [Treponema sp.]
MNFKRLFIAVLVMIMCFTHVFSQDDSDWYYNKPISNISFKGLNNIKSSDMEGIIHAFIGKKFDNEVFSDLLNRIFALNYFEDVSPVALPGDKDYKTVKIELNVVEYPVVSDLRIVGYKKIRGSELRDAISTKEKSIYDEDKRYADEQVIRNLYISRGFSEATVRSEVIESDDGFKVTFYVKEGKQTVVKDIVFTGNTIATSRTLKSKLVSKVQRLFQKGAFQDASIEQDKKAILQYYGENGYVDAKIINATQTSEYNEKKSRQEVTLQYNIQEGSQYTYGGTTIQGNKVFSTDELLSLIKLKEGAVFNTTKFQEGISGIQNKYFSNGYWSNNFVPQIDKDSNNKTISYRIYIQEGLRSHVESITIKGNKRTRDEVIRREIPIESGDIFSNEKVNTGIRNLYNLQYFKQVVPDVKPGSEENLVDVSFNVEEQSTRSVQFGLTFSGTANAGEFPISLFGGFEDTNLFGSGKTGSISATLSTTEQSITLGYGQNWIFDLPISNYVSFGYTRSIRSTPRNVILPDGTFDYYSYYMKYTQHKFTVSDTVSRRWTPNFANVKLSTGITSSLITNI